MPRPQATLLLLLVSCSTPVAPREPGPAVAPADEAPEPTPGSTATTPNATTAPASSPLDELDWMLGRWRVDDGERVHEEVWIRHAPDVWLGFNRATRRGRTRGHELLRLDGTERPIRYVAAPVKQAVTPFALADHAPRDARFTHPSHDPSWVHYVREGDRMTASIGGPNAEEAYATWRFRKVGDGAMREVAIYLCRTEDGDGVRMILPPVGGPSDCRAELFCRAFDTPRGPDLHAAYVTAGNCATRDQVIATCDAPDGPLSLHGTSLQLDDVGCTELRALVLHVEAR